MTVGDDSSQVQHLPVQVSAITANKALSCHSIHLIELSLNKCIRKNNTSNRAHRETLSGLRSKWGIMEIICCDLHSL